MRLSGERRAARARALVGSFRPRPTRGDVVLTGFGPFPGAARNATAEVIRAIAAAHGIALRAPSFHARDFLVGRGTIALASGRTIAASLMVLPVVWDAAGALVAKEARATRASLVVMSGVAAAVQPIFVEAAATGARAPTRDAFGLRPSRRAAPGRTLRATLDVDGARDAMKRALDGEVAAAPALAAAVPGVVRHEPSAENAYVCNATAHVTALAASRGARVLRSHAAPDGLRLARIAARHGFVHWPRDVAPEHAPACARVLLAMIDAVVSSSKGA